MHCHYHILKSTNEYQVALLLSSYTKLKIVSPVNVSSSYYQGEYSNREKAVYRML